MSTADPNPNEEKNDGATDSKDTTPEKATISVTSTPKRAKRPFWKAVLSNPLFWLVVSIALLICAIEYFERYTQIGINNTYRIF